MNEFIEIIDSLIAISNQERSSLYSRLKQEVIAGFEADHFSTFARAKHYAVYSLLIAISAFDNDTPPGVSTETPCLKLLSNVFRRRPHLRAVMFIGYTFRLTGEVLKVASWHWTMFCEDTNYPAEKDYITQAFLFYIDEFAKKFDTSRQASRIQTWWKNKYRQLTAASRIERTSFLEHMKNTVAKDKYGNTVDSIYIGNIFLANIIDAFKSSWTDRRIKLLEKFNYIFYSKFKYLPHPVNSINEIINIMAYDTNDQIGFWDKLDYRKFKHASSILDQTALFRDRHEIYRHKFYTRLEESSKESEIGVRQGGFTDPEHTIPQFLDYFEQKRKTRSLDRHKFRRRHSFFNYQSRIPLVGHMSGSTIALMDHVYYYVNNLGYPLTLEVRDICMFYFTCLGLCGHHDILECLYNLELRPEWRKLFKITPAIDEGVHNMLPDNYFMILRRFFNLNQTVFPQYNDLLENAIREYYQTYCSGKLPSMQS